MKTQTHLGSCRPTTKYNPHNRRHMETLKQRTIDGTKYTLERQPTDKAGKQYEYMIRAGKGQPGRTKTINPSTSIYTRAEAESMFKDIIADVQQSQAKARQRERENERSSGMGFGVDSLFDGGGSGPQIPDFGGGFGGGMDDEDDDEPMFPWF